MPYRIKDWDQVFENFRSREIDDLKNVQWPVRRQSDAFKVLMASPEGREAYGIFGAIVSIAAQAPRKKRGVLEDDRGELTARRIAVKIGAPTEAVQSALKLLSEKEIGWLRVDGRCTVDAPSMNGRCAVERRTDADREIEEKREREIDRKKSAAAPLFFPPAIDRPEFRAKWAEWEAYRRERGLGVLKPRSINAQFRKLSGWGIQAAMRAIDLSIENAWQGLFEPKENGHGHAKQPSPDERRAAKAAREFPESIRLPIAR